MLLLFFLIFTPASVRSDWASNIEAASNPDDLIEKGILFNEVSKILLTEKFIRVEILVPFPTYEFTMKPDIEKLIQQLSLMWETPSLFCPLNFSSQFATNTSGFNVYWMLHQIDNEISAAQLDLALISNETAMFLKPPQPTKSTRQRRGAGAGVGLAALAAVGLFGGGLAVVVPIHVVYVEFLEIAKTNQKQMLKISAASLIFRTLLLTTLPNSSLTRMKSFSLLKMNWRLLTLSNPKWPRPKTRIGPSFKNNWLFMSKIFIFYVTVINFYSLTSNLTSILISFLLYFQ